MALRDIFLIGGVLVSLLIAGIVSAQQSSDDVTININVTQSISIDVNPNSVSWNQLNIGETGTPSYFTVTNVGSVNITSLRANITNDATNPYGTGTSSNYNAGEFVLMNTTSAGFYYVNKMNWNESIPGEVTSPTDFTEGADTGYFGIIRTASDSDVGQDYYWFINRTASSGDCATSSSVLLLGNDPKNVSSTGSIDFTDSGEYTSIPFGAGVSAADISSGDFSGYCAIISADCSTVTLTRWNTDLDSGSACTNDQVFYDGTSPNELSPGSYTWFWLEPKIPNGVPDGDVSQGTLTIIASG
jgi:hypothetical protein